MNTNYKDGGLLTNVYVMGVNMAEYTVSGDMIIKSVGDGISMLQNLAQDNKRKVKILNHDAEHVPQTPA